MLDDCVIYLRTVLLFISPFMLQNVFQSFLVTAQKPHAGLIVTIIAGLTNMSLEPYLSLFSAGVSPVLPWQQGSASVSAVFCL